MERPEASAALPGRGASRAGAQRQVPLCASVRLCGDQLLAGPARRKPTSLLSRAVPSLQKTADCSASEPLNQ